MLHGSCLLPTRLLLACMNSFGGQVLSLALPAQGNQGCTATTAVHYVVLQLCCATAMYACVSMHTEGLASPMP